MRLFLGGEMEGEIKDFYENQKHKSLRMTMAFGELIRFKDDRHCSHLITEVIDLDGRISPARVSNKLKQLRLKVAPTKKMGYVDEHGLEGKVAERPHVDEHEPEFSLSD